MLAGQVDVDVQTAQAGVALPGEAVQLALPAVVLDGLGVELAQVVAVAPDKVVEPLCIPAVEKRCIWSAWFDQIKSPGVSEE